MIKVCQQVRFTTPLTTHFPQHTPLPTQVCSLGRRLGALLLDLSHCRALCPRLQAALKAAAVTQQTTGQHPDRGFDAHVSGAFVAVLPMIRSAS